MTLKLHLKIGCINKENFENTNERMVVELATAWTTCDNENAWLTNGTQKKYSKHKTEKQELTVHWLLSTKCKVCWRSSRTKNETRSTIWRCCTEIKSWRRWSQWGWRIERLRYNWRLQLSKWKQRCSWSSARILHRCL